MGTAPVSAEETACITMFMANEPKSANVATTLLNGPYTILAKRDVLFRKKPRTVLLLREQPTTVYVAPPDLRTDLQGTQCPQQIEKIGEKTVGGRKVAMFHVAGNVASKQHELELGRPVEMYELKKNRKYIATDWQPRQWYTVPRVVFLVAGSRSVYLANKELEAKLRAHAGKQIEFSVIGVEKFTSRSKHKKREAVIEIHRVIT